MPWKILFLTGWMLFAGCATQEDFSGPPRTPIPGTTKTIQSLQRQPAFAKLSDYRMLRLQNGALVVNEGVIPYDLNSPLFSDYAQKFRTIWLPPGTTAAYAATTAFDFPVGTVITKTFSFAADLRQVDAAAYVVETRVLVKQNTGWVALPYLWNQAQTDADLLETGASFTANWIHYDGTPKTTTYLIPNVNQCKECHGNIDPLDPTKTKVLGLIGLKAKHLNKTYSFDNSGRNQLQVLLDYGYLTGWNNMLATDKLANWEDTQASLASRARAILDINCAHCHNPYGTGASSKLLLGSEISNMVHLGVCSTPIRSIDEKHPTTYDIDPGKPELSAVYVRMNSTDPEVMMPRLGRSLVFTEGVKVIYDWIAAMEGDCDQ